MAQTIQPTPILGHAIPGDKLHMLSNGKFVREFMILDTEKIGESENALLYDCKEKTMEWWSIRNHSNIEWKINQHETILGDRMQGIYDIIRKVKKPEGTIFKEKGLMINFIGWTEGGMECYLMLLETLKHSIRFDRKNNQFYEQRWVKVEEETC